MIISMARAIKKGVSLTIIIPVLPPHCATFVNTYGTAQMLLHSRARVMSQALKGLLKVTRHKLC